MVRSSQYYADCILGTACDGCLALKGQAQTIQDDIGNTNAS
jgi:hypothetical protein